MMKTYLYPEKNSWFKLAKRAKLDNDAIENVVSEILQAVKDGGDNAIRKLNQTIDGVNIKNLSINPAELLSCDINKNLKTAILKAKRNIETFHKAQLATYPTIETEKGVYCWRKNVPIETVGLYIPGGTAPLFSTVLMLGIPAKIAGCKEIILCTPPNKNGSINPIILYTAKLVGIEKIYKVGGAQAIAAMAFGTESIPKCDKIFGPGNQYVTKAKEMTQQLGTAIDMPAGPSELLVIADKNADPSFIASDLLSQAEHGTDSQVILLTDDEALPDKVLKELENQMAQLPRKNIAKQALNNSKIIVFKDLLTCMEFSNFYAPEHLIINTSINELLIDKIINAGSVFIGPYSCESAGDYASGTNHTLPTNGFAKNFSGLSVDSFMKKITFQEISKEGIKNLGKTIEVMAEAEQLTAHKNAVSIRLKKIENEKY